MRSLILALFLFCSDLNDQAKWIAHMDQSCAAKFLVWQWEQGGQANSSLNLMLSVRPHPPSWPNPVPNPDWTPSTKLPLRHLC